MSELKMQCDHGPEVTCGWCEMFQPGGPLDPQRATAASELQDTWEGELAQALRVARTERHRAMALADQLQPLRDENTALLAENARLRRGLEGKR